MIKEKISIYILQGIYNYILITEKHIKRVIKLYAVIKHNQSIMSR